MKLGGGQLQFNRGVILSNNNISATIILWGISYFECFDLVRTTYHERTRRLFAGALDELPNESAIRGGSQKRTDKHEEGGRHKRDRIRKDYRRVRGAVHRLKERSR